MDPVDLICTEERMDLRYGERSFFCFSFVVDLQVGVCNGVSFQNHRRLTDV